MDVGAAQLLLGHRLAQARHHRRAGGEHLRDALDHQRVMAGDQARGAQAGDRAQAERDDRHFREIVADLLPAGIARHIGAACLFVRFDRAATAGAVDQPHDGNAELAGHPLGDHLLLVDRRVGGAAAYGEVVAAHRHRPALDAAATTDEVRGLEVEQLAVPVVLRLAAQRADLVEAAGIEQLIDALPYRELAAVVLALDLVRPAHASAHRLAAAQLVDLRLPAHGAFPFPFIGCPLSAARSRPSPRARRWRGPDRRP